MSTEYASAHPASLIKMLFCYSSACGTQPSVTSQRRQMPPINDDRHPTGWLVFFLRNVLALETKNQRKCSGTQTLQTMQTQRDQPQKAEADTELCVGPQQPCRPPDGCHALCISLSFFFSFFPSVALKPSVGTSPERAPATRRCTTDSSPFCLRLRLTGRSSYRDHGWM